MKPFKSDDYTKTFPLYLTSARKARGYKTRGEFAKMMKLDPQKYSAHEKGLTEPKLTDLVFYAKNLDVCLTWLLTGENNPLAHKSDITPEEEARFAFYINMMEAELRIRDQMKKDYGEDMSAKIFKKIS